MMNNTFEDWWQTHKSRYHGSFSDIFLIKHNIKIGWDAHKIDSMKPLAQDIIVKADEIKDNAIELKEQIDKAS